MARSNRDRLLDRHRRQAQRRLAELSPAGYEPPYTPGGGSGGASIEWVKVVTVYDEQPGGPGKHEDYGRCLGVHRVTLSFPEAESGEDLTWTEGETEEIAFPDPIVLDALDQARADPGGLGDDICLDDYYEVNQLYKAATVGRLIVFREPFAILGGPEY